MRNLAGTRETMLPRQILRFSSLVSRTGLLLLILALSVLVSGEHRSEVSRAFPYALTDRQRYGFAATSSTWRDRFDVTPLDAGWYVDANSPACATSPGGMDRALMIKVHYWLDSPRWSWLETMVDSHPGALWLVGNEPDCIWQDNLLPQDYAHIYHDIHTFLRERDPSAMISPGGIVQPTPLRLEWLDRVLAQYQLSYGEPMPVDVWNIHNAILNEVNRECDPDNAWGADIPPGIDACEGVLRTPQDNDDLTIFVDQIWAFRQWMEDRGYGEKPLIVSEFGILMSVDHGFDVERVNAFMDATFQFFATATSTELGDPNDGGRLVQRWAWFSLDNPPYDASDPQPNTFNGNLFDPYTTDITEYGVNFATHTDSFPSPYWVDLSPVAFWFQPLRPVPAGETVNRTVEVEVQNLGTRDSGPLGVRLEYAGPVSGWVLRTIPNLPGGSSAPFSFELAQLQQGAYDISVRVDPDNQISESTECDNGLVTTMVVPTDLMHLPLVAR